MFMARSSLSPLVFTTVPRYPYGLFYELLACSFHGSGERLRRQLDEARRAHKRQAGPFAKGQSKPNSRKPAHKPAKDYGTTAHRQPPSPEQIYEIREARLPDRCLDYGISLDETYIVQ
jgi:hypothetical protein